MAEYSDGLAIFSITDPENPEKVGPDSTYRMGCEGLAVNGDYLYLLDGNEILTVYSIVDPEHPELIDYFNAYGNDDIIIANEYAFVSGLGIRIIDIIEPENPVEVVHIHQEEGRVLDIAISGEYAFSAFGDGGLRVISSADPEQLEEIANIDFPPNLRGITVIGNYAYINNSQNGFRIISIDEPENPQEVGHIAFNEGMQYKTVHDIAVAGDFAFLVGDDLGLRVISITDPEEPQEVGSLEPFDNFDSFSHIVVAGDYAYMSDSRDVWVVSIADSENPEEVIQLPFHNRVSDIAILEDQLFIAVHDTGLYVFSVADPRQSDEIGFYAERINALDIKISGNYAYIAAGYEGLYVLSISDLQDIHEVGYYNTTGYARNITLSEDGLIFVSDQTNLGIYRFTDPNTVDDPTITIPGMFKLYPAYPNPFNSTTTISYGLPYRSNVSLRVYNPSGQRITTLFEGYKQRGFHTTTLSANNLPTGLYFVQLNATNQVLTQKVMLIR